LGEALLVEGDAKDAVPELELAAHLAPGNPDYHRELSRAGEGRALRQRQP
jgi:hypothetical protein